MTKSPLHSIQSKWKIIAERYAKMLQGKDEQLADKICVDNPRDRARNAYMRLDDTVMNAFWVEADGILPQEVAASLKKHAPKNPDALEIANRCVDAAFEGIRLQQDSATPYSLKTTKDHNLFTNIRHEEIQGKETVLLKVNADRLTQAIAGRNSTYTLGA